MITIRSDWKKIPTLFAFFVFDKETPPIYIGKAAYVAGSWLVMVLNNQDQEIWESQWPIVATVRTQLDAALALMCCEVCIPRIYFEGRA